MLNYHLNIFITRGLFSINKANTFLLLVYNQAQSNREKITESANLIKISLATE